MGSPPPPDEDLSPKEDQPGGVAPGRAAAPGFL